MALKHVETKLELDGSGRLNPNLWACEQRTVSTIRQLQCNLAGGWHGVQLLSQCSHSYNLLDLGRPDVGKSGMDLTSMMSELAFNVPLTLERTLNA